MCHLDHLKTDFRDTQQRAHPTGNRTGQHTASRGQRRKNQQNWNRHMNKARGLCNRKSGCFFVAFLFSGQWILEQFGLNVSYEVPSFGHYGVTFQVSPVSNKNSGAKRKRRGDGSLGLRCAILITSRPIFGTRNSAPTPPETPRANTASRGQRRKNQQNWNRHMNKARGLCNRKSGCFFVAFLFSGQWILEQFGLNVSYEVPSFGHYGVTFQVSPTLSGPPKWMVSNKNSGAKRKRRGDGSLGLRCAILITSRPIFGTRNSAPTPPETARANTPLPEAAGGKTK